MTIKKQFIFCFTYYFFYLLLCAQEVLFLLILFSQADLRLKPAIFEDIGLVQDLYQLGVCQFFLLNYMGDSHILRGVPVNLYPLVFYDSILFGTVFLKFSPLDYLTAQLIIYLNSCQFLLVHDRCLITLAHVIGHLTCTKHQEFSGMQGATQRIRLELLLDHLLENCRSRAVAKQFY